jgi:hypothetical protein
MHYRDGENNLIDESKGEGPHSLAINSRGIFFCCGGRKHILILCLASITSCILYLYLFFCNADFETKFRNVVCVEYQGSPWRPVSGDPAVFGHGSSVLTVLCSIRLLAVDQTPQ